MKRKAPANSPHRSGIRHAEREQAAADQDREAEIGQQLERQDAGNAGRRVADGFRRRMHVARPKQPDELVTEMVAVEQDENDEDHDDADGQQRMQQRRHEGRHAREIGRRSARAPPGPPPGSAVTARSRPARRPWP